jgi:nucleoside-diphosphate-sugar epimerase
MKIFVTGATGFIGQAVAEGLARAGHDVLGLVRNAAKAPRLEAAEITPVIGDMAEPAGWTPAAQSAEAVIHCAAEYSARYMELDRQTTERLLSLQPRLFIYTSGCWVYGNTGDAVANESSALRPPSLVQPRVETERLVLAAASPATRTLVIRPGCVYGGHGSLTAAWFESAENEGASRIIGDGACHWPMIHVAGLAELYRLAAESPLTAEIFNGVDGATPTVRECAEAASRAVLGTPAVTGTPREEALYAMGPMAECLTLDQRLDGSKARRLLGWQCRHRGFVAGAPRYYRAWKASAK